MRMNECEVFPIRLLFSTGAVEDAKKAQQLKPSHPLAFMRTGCVIFLLLFFLPNIYSSTDYANIYCCFDNSKQTYILDVFSNVSEGLLTIF